MELCKSQNPSPSAAARSVQEKGRYGISKTMRSLVFITASCAGVRTRLTIDEAAMKKKYPVTISPTNSGKEFHVLLDRGNWSEIKIYGENIRALKGDMIEFLGYKPRINQIKFERMGEERIKECLVKLEYMLR
jgi:hypothetical protein